MCVHASLTFFHYYDSTCSSKAVPSTGNTTPPSGAPCVCAWLGLSASAHSPPITGLAVTTLLHTEGRRIRENIGAGTELTYGAIDNLFPSQQNRIGEGREEGGRGERGGGGGGEGGKERKSRDFQSHKCSEAWQPEFICSKGAEKQEGRSMKRSQQGL